MWKRIEAFEDNFEDRVKGAVFKVVRDGFLRRSSCMEEDCNCYVNSFHNGCASWQTRPVFAILNIYGMNFPVVEYCQYRIGGAAVLAKYACINHAGGVFAGGRSFKQLLSAARIRLIKQPAANYRACIFYVCGYVPEKIISELSPGSIHRANRELFSAKQSILEKGEVQDHLELVEVSLPVFATFPKKISLKNNIFPVACNSRSAAALQ